MVSHLSVHVVPDISKRHVETHQQNHKMIFGSDTSRLIHFFGVISFGCPILGSFWSHASTCIDEQQTCHAKE